LHHLAACDVLEVSFKFKYWLLPEEFENHPEIKRGEVGFLLFIHSFMDLAAQHTTIEHLIGAGDVAVNEGESKSALTEFKFEPDFSETQSPHL
jgi:hypothetical protein